MLLPLVVLICSSSLALGRSPIPFSCPAVPIKDPELCARVRVQASNCKTDSDCRGGEKCCPALCGTRRCKGSPPCRKIPYDSSCRYRKIAPGCKTNRECPPGTQCCAAECGINQCIPLEDRPGCPSSSIVCVTTSMECFYDQQCKNGGQCCFSKNCGYSCVKPQPTCPPAPPFKEECTRRLILPGCKEDADCKTGTLCCASECGVKQCVVVGPRPGCPRINPDIRCIRFAQDCLADVDCERGAKCCLGSCGYTCIGGSNTNPKDEKPGTCPARPAFVPKECLNNRPPSTCKNDFNCPKPWQKCCSGLCGNFACTDAHADKRCPSYRRDISCKRFDFQCSSKKICRKGSICCPESCGSRCVTLKPKRSPRFCRLRRRVGPCRGRIPRFYYNRKTKTCTRFLYGGCRGNRNNFPTKEACEQKCNKNRPGPGPAGPTGPSPPGPPECLLPKRVGPCDGAYQRYFYCAKLKRCVIFTYGGCGGNANNFETKRECEQTCMPPSVNPCPVPGCIAPPKGSCTKRKIVVINGRGCPLCLEQVPCPECSLPKKVGPCKARIPRYFFNKNTGLCGRFFWGGCQPNKNNFKTFEDCQRRCGGKRPDCFLPKKVGPCEALIPRYFYNKKTLRCEKFIYGGCEGNENNFESLSDCQAQCKKDKPVCGPVCAIFCPFGNVLDDKGCPTCRCKTGCKGNVKPVGEGCAPGKRRCPGGSKCIMIPGGTSGVCCRQCPLLRCKECELGNVIDENGCRTCQCNPDPCKHGSASPVRFCTQGQSDCPTSQKCVQITNKGDKSVCCPKAPCLARPCPRPPPDWCTEPTYYYNEDGVRCPGCYKRVPCDNKPCPQIRCSKFCEFGSFPLDGYPHCPSCDCKQACEDGAKPLSGVSCGSGSQRCPGNYKCSKSVSLLTKKRVCCLIKPKCGPVCAIFCKFGNVIDDRGCPTCECKPGCENGATPGKPCRSDSECFAKPGSTATCVKNGSSRTRGICCSKGGNNVCPKGQPKGRCSLGIPPTNCGQGQFCRNNVCCDIPCPNGPPLVGETCSQFAAGPKCPPGSRCLGGPADEYFACCPNSNGNFVCPKPIGAGICVEQCSKDSDCSPGDKCCSNGCGHVCRKACRIPMCLVPCLFGSILDKNGCETCNCKTGCKNNAPVTGSCEVDDRQCPRGDKCVKPPGVPTKRGVCCSQDKPGECPTPIGAGTCVELCSGDGSCPRDQKCCSNGCGHVCTDPVKPNPVKCQDGSKPLKDIFCGRGPNRRDCPDDYSCYIDPTDRFAVCCKVRACTKIGCRFPCEHGSFPDKNGCPTCNCKPAPKKRYP